MPIQDSTPEYCNSVISTAARIADDWARSSGTDRSGLLRQMANMLLTHREELVHIANEETSLDTNRLNAELDRTIFQLKGFADHVDAGHAFAMTIDEAISQAPPMGRPHLARVLVPLGPVAVFAASNFPLAFSVLGGDTVSALAAGCSVVVKAHPGHPRLSRAVVDIARTAIKIQGLPEGLLGMVEGSGVDVGVQLVRHPDIAAVAFTGSYKGGIALLAHANARPEPIPFYGELGSINPIIALPKALAEQAEEAAQMLASSIQFGSGQICTSPGVVLLYDNADSDAFEFALCGAMDAMHTHAMLSPSIKKNFDAGVSRVLSTPGVKAILSGRATSDDFDPPRPVLAKTSAKNFIQYPTLHEEVFGPACLLINVESADEIINVLTAIKGSLTVTLWGGETDTSDVRRITRIAAKIAGRVLFGGVPTGVAVSASQHHGGPWPSSTQPFSTSVGYAAMERFLRPVALQNSPAWLIERKGQPC
jgi:NADP-dependent aldehyde dehydrogenase